MRFDQLVFEMLRDYIAREREMQHSNASAVVEMDVRRWIDVSARDDNGKSVLHYAFDDNSFSGAEIAKYLIAAGADVNARDDDDRTPLHYCDDYHVACALIDAGADVNARDGEGRTPLHAAILDGSELETLLVGNGADVNARDSSGNAPLHYARVAYNLSDCGNMFGGAEYLLKNGADVNAQNSDGNTPLHLAQYFGSDSDCVHNSLLYAGADVYILNNDGVPAEDYNESVCVRADIKSYRKNSEKFRTEKVAKSISEKFDEIRAPVVTVSRKSQSPF